MSCCWAWYTGCRVSHHAEQLSYHLPFAQWPAEGLSRSGDRPWHLSLLVSAFLWQEEDSSTWQSQGDGLPSAGWTAGASRCFQGSEAYSFCCCFKIRYGSGVCHWYFKKENVSIDFYMNGCILYSSTIYLGSSKCHLFSRQHFLITISSDLTWFLSAPQLCA